MFTDIIFCVELFVYKKVIAKVYTNYYIISIFDSDWLVVT